MARKQKDPPAPPSKAYLVSFGDTMTALLAFFIVLNSFAKEQTGANMHTGTGSFVNAVSSSGLPGSFSGKRSNLTVEKKDAAPVYAFGDPDQVQDHQKRLGPDEDPDDNPIKDRQTDEFKRFLTQMSKEFEVVEQAPTKKQIVLDSFEKFERQKGDRAYFPMKEQAIRVASEAITKLLNGDYEIDVVVWAKMPSRLAMKEAMEKSLAIQNQIDNAFLLSKSQRSRLTFSAKPWLFSDAKRPKMSFVLSRMDNGVALRK
ncbi:MAG: flagellar motor protein MotB [Mariniblastus sp.]